ncbi:MAG TPA: nucleoside triphosphate pyrophosphohydrolase [Candidatus Binatia bacterium]
MDYKLAGEKFAELLEIMGRLRSRNGCPWDKEQTHGSLKQFLLEESHELLDVLDGKDAAKIREELGDLLHQIVFHCQIAAESGAFTAADVIAELNNKIVRRHPHVFSGQALPDSAAVIKQWAEIKAQENSEGMKPSALGNLPKSMPALTRAQKISERASCVGFDWPSVEPVWQKIEEELNELKNACAACGKTRMKDELGDLFFALVNLARFLGIQAEESLNQTTAKFITRFNYIEARLQEAGKTPMACSLEELDRYWDEAKALERGGESRK